MKKRIILLCWGLCLVIGGIVIFGSQAQLTSANSGFQDNSCDELLTRILERAGWGQINQPQNSCEYLGVGSNFYATVSLSIDPGDGSPYVIHSCNENTVPDCSESTFHGYPAITAVSDGTGSMGWTMLRGNTEFRFYVFMGEGYDVMKFAEELVAAAEQELPATSSSVPEPTIFATEVDPSTSDCSGVTPDELREGGLTVMRCRLHCDPNIMSDEELMVCIDQFSGQTVNGNDPQDPNGITPPDSIPDGETLPPSSSIPDTETLPPSGYIPDAETILPPDDTAGSNTSKQLGPLATSPFVPLAGGLIGTVVGWLVSVATTSGHLLKTAGAASLPVTPAPARPVSVNPAPASSRGTQPVSSGRPANSPNELTSPLSAEPPPTPGECLWDLATNFAGNGSTVIGTLNEFFDFQDSAGTVQRVQDAMRTWHNNPTEKAAENYVKSIGRTINVRLKNISDNLGNLSTVMDGVDAVRAGLNTATERGYTGDDKLLAVGAEYSKKVLNIALTKNPVVGLVNAAVGGATQLTFGEEGRVDIGSLIDKGSAAWDATTQDYANYTDGSYLPGNYADELAMDANIQRKDQYLHGIRQIKKLIWQGKITREEGCVRIRILRDIQGGN